MEYPKFLFSKAGKVLLRNSEDELNLDGEWFDSPAKVPFEPVALEPEAAEQINVAEEVKIEEEIHVQEELKIEDDEVQEQVKRGRGRPPKESN